MNFVYFIIIAGFVLLVLSKPVEKLMGDFK
jgi:hypothetical protein